MKSKVGQPKTIVTLTIPRRDRNGNTPSPKHVARACSLNYQWICSNDIAQPLLDGTMMQWNYTTTCNAHMATSYANITTHGSGSSTCRVAPKSRNLQRATQPRALNYQVSSEKTRTTNQKIWLGTSVRSIRFCPSRGGKKLHTRTYIHRKTIVFSFNNKDSFSEFWGTNFLAIKWSCWDKQGN